MVVTRPEQLELSKPKITSSETHTPPIWLFWRSRRYVVLIYVFLGLAVNYALRANMGFAIVAMTNYYNHTFENGSVILQQDFEWTTVEQGYILSAFFYGFIISQIISGGLAIKLQAKHVIGITNGTASLLTVVTPWLASINIYIFIAVRVLTGFCEGWFAPFTQQIFLNWTPVKERNRLIAMTISGTYFGTIVAFPLSSLVSASFGWPSIFYVLGTIGIVWTILWTLMTSNTPQDDPRINSAELDYLNQSHNEINNDKIKNMPWKSMITSLPVWALIFANGSEYWGFYTLLNQLPKYMNYVLNFNLTNSGLISSLPYVGLFLVLHISGYLADYIQSKGWIKVSTLRKAFLGIGFLSQSIFFLLSIYLINPLAASCCIILAVSIGGMTLSVISVNFLDIAPRFASLILGTAGCFSVVQGIISPTIIGYIVTDETNTQQWNVVFYITASVYVIGAIFYALCGSAEEQKWNNLKNTSCDGQ